MLSKAITLSPKNSLCKFERASILFAAERYTDALQELNELKELVPKESPVYFLLGKVGLLMLMIIYDICNTFA